VNVLFCNAYKVAEPGLHLSRRRSYEPVCTGGEPNVVRRVVQLTQLLDPFRWRSRDWQTFRMCEYPKRPEIVAQRFVAKPAIVSILRK